MPSQIRGSSGTTPRGRRLTVLVDASVFLYALGGEHELRSPCREVLARQGLELHASVELVQEVVFHRMRRGERTDAVAVARLVADSCQLHDFDSAVLRRALSLIAEGGVGGRAAVHAATALEAGISVIVSPDSDFDGIDGLSRIDPRSLNEVLGGGAREPGTGESE